MRDSQPLNLKALRSFLEVAKLGSFTRAAQSLGISQPAVSNHIRKLTESLGTPLLDVVGSGVELTLAGRLLQDRGRALLADADRLEEELGVLASSRPVRLKVGASTTPGIYLLPGILGSLTAKDPGLEVRCVIESSGAIEARVAAGELDCGLIGRRPEDPRLRSERFARDRIVLVGPLGHPLARKKKLTSREFLEQAFIMREPGSATREFLEAWFRKAAILPRVVMELTSPEAIKRMVAAGLGISAISRHSMGVDPAAEGLALLPPLDPALERDLLVIYRDESQTRPAVTGFLEAVRSFRPPAD